jgi:uncharacterized protein YjbI with pentapeptide repeats
MSDDQARVTPPSATDKVLSNRVIAWCAVGLVLVAAGVGWPLLAIYGLGLEAIRTVGTIVLGAGGAVGLLLAARRQQTAERDLAEKRRDLVLKEHVQQHTETDAAERRITELYAKAVEQLGSDKAPVRLGGLYALERLAQTTSSQRTTVVNVLCAYLRMPFEPGGVVAEPPQDPVQERHVRIAAQRILAQHLRPGPNPASPADTFWADTDLDLMGAALVGFRFDHCRIRSAQFTEATFDGDANFGGTVFLERAEFDRTTFHGEARFSEATFAEEARFRTVRFLAAARFRATAFRGDARFTGARFHGNVWLGDAVFHSGVWFTQTHFGQDIRFDGAVFEGNARFHDATFDRSDQPKMFRDAWARPASRSLWPPGWAPTTTTDEPSPGSGGSWQKLLPS